MSTRTAISDIRLKFKSVLNFLMDDGWLSALTMGGWIVRQRLQTGVETNQANRAWEYEATIASGDTLDMNLYGMDGIDIGGGAGNDGLGQPLALEEIVNLVIYHVSGAGSLEVMPTDPANKLRWVPTLTVASGGALKAGGAMMMHQPHTDAYDVDGANWETLRLRAMGGDVTFHVYVLARHDDTASSSSFSTSSSSTSTSRSSQSVSSSSSSSTLSLSSSTLSSLSSSCSSKSEVSSSSSTCTSISIGSSSSGVVFGEGWERRCAITINHNAIDSTLTDFTCVFNAQSLPAEMLNTSSGNECVDGGGDVVFTSDAAGITRLSVDVRQCHPTAGGVGAYANIAVKVPVLSSSVDTSIYIWYRKPGASQPAVDVAYGRYDAYDSNYACVLPLDESGTGAVGEYVDRTSNAKHARGGGGDVADVPSRVDGTVYKGQQFDGVSDWIALGSVLTTGDFTVHGLMKTPAAWTGLSEWWTGAASAPYRANYGFISGAHYFYLGNQLAGSGSYTFSAGTWYHVGFVHNNTTNNAISYVNGSPAITLSSVGFGGQSGFNIGSYDSGTSSFFSGVVEEFRVSSAVRSAAWLKAEYRNLLSPAAFATVGTPVAIVAESSSSSSRAYTSTMSVSSMSTTTMSCSSVSSMSSSTASSKSSTSCSTSMSGGPQYTVEGFPAGLEVEVGHSYLFVVTLLNADELTGSVVITPSASNGDDGFNPASVTLSEAEQSAEIEYTPDDAGERTITFDNDRGLNSEIVTFTGLVVEGMTVVRLGNPSLYPVENFEMMDHGGYPLFGPYDPSKPLSVVNKDISADELDPDSDAILAGYEALNMRVRYEIGYMAGAESYLNYGWVTTVVRGTYPLVPINYVGYGITDGDHVPMRIPPWASAQSYWDNPVTQYPHPTIPTYADQQVCVLDPDNDALYELYAAYTPDDGDSWTASGGAKWDLSTGALRTDSLSSADGCGMPIYPLLLRYDEVMRAIDDGTGYVPHALRFTTKWARRFSIWPARHAAGGAASGLCWGDRLRLKQAWYDENEHLFQQPVARVVLKTLVHYGMYMCDLNGAFSVSCCMDRRWPVAAVYELENSLGATALIHVHDLEVLKREYGCTLTGPTTGQVGVPCGPFTVSRVPINDANYQNTIYIGDGSTWFDHTVLSPSNPTHDFYYTPTSAGVKAVSLYQIECYWWLPPAITLTVT